MNLNKNTVLFIRWIIVLMFGDSKTLSRPIFSCIAASKMLPVRLIRAACTNTHRFLILLLFHLISLCNSSTDVLFNASIVGNLCVKTINVVS